jgi:hypothetical protein
MNITTRKMSDAHEAWLVDLFGGRMTKGSGNQWHNQMDGRQNSRQQYYAFAWDGKATLGKSVGVTREMWKKAVQQAGAERPMLPLRWYDTEQLKVGLDLVVVSADDLACLIKDANRYWAAKEQGCLTGDHQPLGRPAIDGDYCDVCGADLWEAES